MRLLVLAGGFGTRLRAAVKDIPKALAPVGDEPFLRLQLERWRSQGVTEFCFLLHHQADQLISFIVAEQAGLLSNCHVDWLVESSPLDTGGAVANAIRELQLKGDFLVANADTWLGAGLSELIRNPSPAMTVVKRQDVGRYGQVQFDESFVITRFIEKGEISEPGWINAGAFRLSAELFDNWDGRPFSLERRLFADLVRARQLKAVPLQTDFIDIGIPEDYRRFCRWVSDGCKTPL